MTELQFGTYEKAIHWLFAQVPNYQAQGASAYKPGLGTIEALLAFLDNPHHKFKSIHVAGTNGKGSTCHMMASIYQQSGYKVGIFTSPHIVDFRERIKINGQVVSEDFVLNFINQTFDQIGKLGASFFEITTAMAFLAFAAENVDVAIVETGLGGRLDATNVLKPELAVITNIGIDHVQFLGDTIPQIAAEKAGIIKEDTPVLMGRKQTETLSVFDDKAKSCNVQINYARAQEFKTDLVGRFQAENMNTAVCAVELLQSTFQVGQDAISKGLLQVVRNTNFSGRFQIIHEHPKVIVDAAHNPAGLELVLAELNELEFETLRLVYGSSNDKDLHAIFKLLPRTANYYFTEFATS